MFQTKCIVLDLDGTLLNDEKAISPLNRLAIAACKQKGIQIVIATARPPRSVRHLLQDEPFDGYVIYYNGALITNESQGIRHHVCIRTETAVMIAKFLSEHEPQAIISYEVDDAWYCIDPVPENRCAEFGLRPKDPKPTVVDKSFFDSLSPTKILILGLQHWEAIRDHFVEDVNVICTDGGILVQIMDKSVSKEHAVRKVLEQMDIPPEETMAFGDDFNDIGLFELCGFPVAMGNAINELKTLTKYVTESNNVDGVAVALQKLVLSIPKGI
ncbi:HAD family hydrolase [Alicyclobacillus fodiniaquatilis]|uniref:HAD family hydrolase n=1 Tax=Alicyclobacillus fodiniaquatilis TaxID=1661150 RepID=A0ABW4JFI8_9BACL